LVGIECVFTAVDVGHEAAQADAADGELELFGVGEEVGVFIFAEGGAVEAVFDGLGVGGRRAGAVQVVIIWGLCTAGAGEKSGSELQGAGGS